jgi:glucose-1-phosphate adenylyltransferase
MDNFTVTFLRAAQARADVHTGMVLAAASSVMSPEIRHGTEQAEATLALVLAGGSGTRLGELTRWHCKPAIPFAGRFRNIDFTLSNCVNSGLRRIAVLTQYKAQSLINHIAAGWSFLARPLGELVEVWPAQQRRHGAWYAGTADAVWQNLDLIHEQHRRYTLVLAGDHIYKLDYRALIARHAASGAGVTVACVPVPQDEASHFGVLDLDSSGWVRGFLEKPAPGSLPARAGQVQASMGIYVFDTGYLVDLLERDALSGASAHDFGRDILPAAVREHRVATYPFVDASGQPGYWRDVGTLEGYWQAHMDLLVPEPPLQLYDAAWPILSEPEQLPPARLLYDAGRRGYVANSLLSGGVLVRGATVTNSVLAGEVAVAEGSLVDEAVILPGVRIGPNCRLRRVVVDSGLIIPEGTCVGWQPRPPLEPCRGRSGVTLVAHSREAASGLRYVA